VPDLSSYVPDNGSTIQQMLVAVQDDPFRG